MKKICTTCSKRKPLADFYSHTTAKDGKHTSCKACHSKYSKKKWLGLCKRPLNSHVQRGRMLKKKYGMTHEDYEKMLSSQNHRCAICGKNESCSAKRRLHVDHDHSTGKIRGLLCSNCNTVLAHAKDSTQTLELAIKYLG